MQVNVRGKNIEVTDALRERVQKKVSKLKRFYGDLGDAQVRLLVEKEAHRVEVTIPLNGMILRGEETTHDMYTSIDLVVDKLEKQLEKYKGKLMRRTKPVSPAVAVEPPKDAFNIVRTKRFALKPMSVEEAVMQMNLLGHSFFVFANADTDDVCVVYKRKQGDYGLIEPE